MAEAGEGGGEGDSMGALQAALQAGADHVWTQSYQQGGEEGWASGWAAGWQAAGLQAIKTATDAQEGLAQAVVDNRAKDQATEQAAEMAAPETRLEMTEEWAAIFKEGADARARKQARRPGDRGSENCNQERKHPVIDSMHTIALGGRSDARRHARAHELYGEAADAILQMEAQLDAGLQAVVARSAANLWPVV